MDGHRGVILGIVLPDLEEGEIEVVEVLSLLVEDINEDPLLGIEGRGHRPQLSVSPEKTTEIVMVFWDELFGISFWSPKVISHSVVLSSETADDFSRLEVEVLDEVFRGMEEEDISIAYPGWHHSGYVIAT